MGITQKPVANGAVNLLIRPRDSSLLRRSFNLYDAIRIAGEQQRRILDASELNKFFSDPDRWGLKPNVARRAGPLVIYAGPNGFSENEFAWSFDRFGKPPMTFQLKSKLPSGLETTSLTIPHMFLDDGPSFVLNKTGESSYELSIHERAFIEATNTFTCPHGAYLGLIPLGNHLPRGYYRHSLIRDGYSPTKPMSVIVEAKPEETTLRNLAVGIRSEINSLKTKINAALLNDICKLAGEACKSYIIDGAFVSPLYPQSAIGKARNSLKELETFVQRSVFYPLSELVHSTIDLLEKHLP